jgi:PAS domain S-box-containing protein
MKSKLDEADSAAGEFAGQKPSPAWPSILMVDDHPARLLTYEAILHGMPVQFVRAHSGEEALQLLLKQSFALILLDVNMPGIDGFEVARHVRGLSRFDRIPIIFVSGERFSDLDRLKGYEVGAIDYISVPIVPEILRSKVALLIELFNRRIELDQLNAAAAGAKRLPDEPRAPGASSDHLRALFEQTSDIKFILRGERDIEGQLSTWRYVDANASALALYGRNREQVVGRTVQEIVPGHAARVAGFCQQALLGRERLQYEAEFAGRQLLVRIFAVDHECVAVTCTDITDGKRVELALANSERRFQALLECCPVGVSQNAIDGRFEYVNAGFCNIVGYTREELLELTWQQITHPDDLQNDLARARLSHAGETPHYTIEKRYLHKNGTPVWVSLFGNFIHDEQRKPVQGVAVVVDITARKLADHDLQESRRRLLLAHDAAGLGSFDWNIEQDSATWDARARELWGLAPETPVNLGAALAGIHPDDRAGFLAAIDRALRGDLEGRYRAIYRVIHVHDGRTRWVESHGQVIFDEGKPLRMVGTKRDITDRVNSENALRKSEERFRELANNIDQVVWTCDAAGQPTWYNDRWYEYSGATFEQMLDDGWKSLVHPEHVERVVGNFRKCIDAGEVWEETCPVRGKAGDYRWFLTRAIPIKAADGTVLRWFGSNTDITAHRKLQDALTEADQRKDEFLAMLAHELRNPVAPILNVAQILSGRGAGDQDVAGMVGIIKRQAQHLARLLDDLLDVARITRGRIELRRGVVRVDDCIALAMETVDPLLRAAGHTLEVERASTDLRVDVDRDRVTQCLTNLLDNAVKYSPPGSRIRIRTSLQEGQAAIEVQDYGRGIRPDMLPRIFELFAQGDRTLDRRYGGLGIGLSVCKRLIEMHGGSIAAHSEGEGRGATFKMMLPLAQAAVLPAGVDERAGEPTASTHKRVLVVDDNQDAAETTAMLLQFSGHETRTVFHGEDALNVWPEFKPDVAILDIGLPDLSGYEVISRMRQAGFRGLAIALSGYGQPEDRRRALEAGFDLHLVKPVDLQALESATQMVPPAGTAQSPPGER